MRRWLVSGLSMVLLFGCGDDESAPAPSPDAGATAVSDTGGASVSDTGTGGAVDAGMPADAASGETVADDTGEQGSDTGAEPIDDGLNGAPCTSPDDCADPEGYLCFGGFCAEICRDDLDGDGASDRIPEACGEVSSASMFGQGFACSSSLRICTPGPVEGQEIYCSKDAECDDVGAGTMVCGLAVLMSSDNRIVDGVCIPGGERNLTGASCQENVECESMLCRGNDPEAGQTGFCTNHCTQNQDCPTGNLCIGTGYLTGDDDTQASAWGGHCYPYEGSLDYCREQSECPAEDVCEAFVEPASLGAQYWCVARNEDGAAVGESCETGSDCNARRCLLGGSGQEGIDGMCTNTCQEASDCAEDMHCANVRLHNNGTPEIPEDDQLYGLCVRGAEGDPCLVGQQFWCEGELSCQQNEAWEAGFGLCAAPLGCHEEGGVVCDDGIECTLDECDASTGECVFSAVAPDWCFIDNGCVAAGASVDNTTCTVCDPSQSQSAASPVPDGTVCDDGDATTSNDACLAGVCACLSDCDGKVCGEDGCGGGAWRAVWASAASSWPIAIFWGCTWR